MNHYIVLYREGGPPMDVPLAFACQGDDADHAEEQCDDAYPDCEIVWVWEGESADDAYQNYWGNDSEEAGA